MISPPSLVSSQFLGLRIAAPSRPSPSVISCPPSPTLLSPRASAAYSAAAEGRTTSSGAGAPPASSFASLYDVLGVPVGSSATDIKAAYRRLARTCHPDVVAGDRKAASPDEFMRIHSAYSTLSDPDKRADYDRQLIWLGNRHRRRAAQPSPAQSPVFTRSPSFPGYHGSRTWETDQCW
ncbi:chaperone protein dnaJ 11, chloroplastic-like [Typha angustifolia]|uniref:chaperone protein dnaJ 11, chloroplastic-like n=1 Tax=Typha angustifolia TaxID=59011 RepID=UPI003C2DC6C0